MLPPVKCSLTVQNRNLKHQSFLLVMKKNSVEYKFTDSQLWECNLGPVNHEEGHKHTLYRTNNHHPFTQTELITTIQQHQSSDPLQNGHERRVSPWEYTPFLMFTTFLIYVLDWHWQLVQNYSLSCQINIIIHILLHIIYSIMSVIIKLVK